MRVTIASISASRVQPSVPSQASRRPGEWGQPTCIPRLVPLDVVPAVVTAVENFEVKPRPILPIRMVRLMKNL